MLLYDSPMPAPNPRRVRMYLAEKGISVPMQQVALFNREHKSPDYLAKYPPGQVPALELDDGRIIGESIAICRYFEALHPEPPLFGKVAIEIAEIDMWLRRIELTLGASLRHIWMHTHSLTAKIVTPQYSDFGESHRSQAIEAMRRMDLAISETPYIAGEAFSIADISLLATVDFGTFIGMVLPDEFAALNDWHRRVSKRPSASV